MLIKKFRIEDKHCDKKGELKLSALQLFMQECAGEDFDSYGTMGDEMRKNGMAFVLTRVTFDIFKKMSKGDLLEILTVHDHIEGISLIREFVITSDKGYCCRATTVWIVLNLNTRRIMRPTALEYYPPTLNLFTQQVESEKRIFAKDETAELVCEIDINNSHIDENGHVNNTFYQDFAAKAIDGRYSDKFLKHIQISYVHEAFEGENLKIYGVFDDSIARVRAMNGEKCCFEALMKFEEHNDEQ